ncbi:MAG TPA: acyl-CoA thioesterase domain-containing protein [Acidimicrobiales bacterium]|nr:acyl-CoA thioesterase domain-containing protein [Acidimicrobiales bacterium]
MEIDETEFMSGSVAQLVDAITSAEVDPGPDGHRVFVSTSPSWWGGDRTFGGMVVAQALHAASRTVADHFEVHSLHGYFLRPSSPGVPSSHSVERVRDGRSFSTREVTTSVEGKTVFRMICSFHIPEVGDSYQLPMGPGIARPEEIDGFEAPFPFDIREVGATDRREDGTYLSTRRCWFRTKQSMPDDPALRACVLAYFSDMTGAAFRPHSLGTWGRHTDASLDHAVWFHRPWKPGAWSIFDLQALVNAGGRSTVRATMHGEDGTLHLSMAQELLIRELEVPIAFDAPPWADRDGRRAVDGGAGQDDSDSGKRSEGEDDGSA